MCSVWLLILLLLLKCASLVRMLATVRCIHACYGACVHYCNMEKQHMWYVMKCMSTVLDTNAGIEMWGVDMQMSFWHGLTSCGSCRSS